MTSKVVDEVDKYVSTPQTFKHHTMYASLMIDREKILKSRVELLTINWIRRDNNIEFSPSLIKLGT